MQYWTYPNIPYTERTITDGRKIRRGMFSRTTAIDYSFIEWLNGSGHGFDTFVVSGSNITSAIADTSDYAQCTTSLSPVEVISAGTEILITVSGFTLNSGTAPNIHVYDGGILGTELYHGVLTDGVISIVPVVDVASLIIAIENYPHHDLTNKFATNFSANFVFSVEEYVIVNKFEVRLELSVGGFSLAEDVGWEVLQSSYAPMVSTSYREGPRSLAYVLDTYTEGAWEQLI